MCVRVGARYMINSFLYIICYINSQAGSVHVTFGGFIIIPEPGMADSSLMREGMLMLQLEREVEVSRLLSESSMLEEQIAELETGNRKPRVKCSSTQTVDDDTLWKHEASQVSFPL